MMRLPIFRGHGAWEERLHSYADGRLSARAATAFEAHRGACSECEATLDRLLEMKAALSALPEREAPRSFRLTPAMVEAPAATSRASVPRRQPGWAMRTAQAGAGLAAVGLFAVIAVDLGSGTTGTSSDEAPPAIAADGADTETMSAQAADGTAGDGDDIADLDGAADDAAGTDDGIEDQGLEDARDNENPIDDMAGSAQDAPPGASFALEAALAEPGDDDDTVLNVLQITFGAALVAALGAFVYLRLGPRRALNRRDQR